MFGVSLPTRPRGGPLACVLGDMDLVRPLGLGGIRCAVFAPEGSSLAHSRYTERLLRLPAPAPSDEALVEALLAFGRDAPQPPVLYFEDDSHLLMVSRHRERLATVLRFFLPPADLVEQLVDKARFAQLAQALDLPVPRARVLHPRPGASVPEPDLRYPLVVKPLTRFESWAAIEAGKALRLDAPGDLRALWPRLAAAGLDLIVQELVPGPESAIESYHVYVDEQGEVAGEFTGRKIRTYPAVYGHSTALTITDLRGQAADVAVLGRAVAARIGLRGVAKFDFKRDPDGRLYLLEINARFNLWHHLGAVAGVNLPALVYADLTGSDRPRPAVARAGCCWCRPGRDRLAAREAGLPTLAWMAWVARCEAGALHWEDPMPLLKPRLQRLARLRPGAHGDARPAVKA
jgi:predicted ATP-grasp superfamily ATP-dependent carboligase